MRNNTTNEIAYKINYILNNLHTPITTLEQLYDMFVKISEHPEVFDITYPQTILDLDKPQIYCAFHTTMKSPHSKYHDIYTIYGYFEDNHITFYCKS